MGGPYVGPGREVRGPASIEIGPPRRRGIASRLKSVAVLTLMAALAIGMFIAAMVLGSIIAAVILLALVIAIFVFWIKFLFRESRRQQ
jgi:predicted lipid-binding transport protein (Tim44 family)